MEERKDYLVENLRDPVWYTETMWKKGMSGFPPAILTCAITGAVMELVFEVFFSPVGYGISRTLGTHEVEA